MVLTNPHIKPRIEFIIMKIFMKIVKICPKSLRFTVLTWRCRGVLVCTFDSCHDECSNMIAFDVVDVSERRFEEVLIKFVLTLIV